MVALEQAVAAPFCSRQLADLGADVDQDRAARRRRFRARIRRRAERSLRVFRVAQSRQAQHRARCEERARTATCARELIARADVFVHNLAPGAVERLGFGYEELAAQHPRLIWCGISGYGPDGPYRDKKAYDLLVQAESGVVSVTGTPESPAKVGISIADISSGMYAYSSILAALLRARTHAAAASASISRCSNVSPSG